MDHSRGLRGSVNSKTTLESLTKEFPSQMNFYLYHTPQLRGYRKRFIPERANETIGVLHMKIYIADDTLIISGLVSYTRKFNFLIVTEPYHEGAYP